MWLRRLGDSTLTTHCTTKNDTLYDVNDGHGTGSWATEDDEGDSEDDGNDDGAPLLTGDDVDVYRSPLPIHAGTVTTTHNHVLNEVRKFDVKYMIPEGARGWRSKSSALADVAKQQG
jgi:hypothetical protein